MFCEWEVGVGAVAGVVIERKKQSYRFDVYELSPHSGTAADARI